MSHDVFISYASEDAAQANRMRAFLQQHGIRCWIDNQDLRFTRKYDREIERAIRRSRVVLWLASSRSIASDYVKFEVATGANCRKTIGPIYLEPMDPARLPAPFNLKLANVQGIEWFQEAEAANLERLAAEVRGLIRGVRKRRAAIGGGIVATALVAALITTWAVRTRPHDAEPGGPRSPPASTDTRAPDRPAAAAFPARLERLPAAEVLKIAYAGAPPVPAASAERPALEFEILARRHTESTFAQLSDGDTLASEQDDYLLVVRPRTPGFLYVFQVDAVGKKTWLFPKNETSAYSSGANPVTPGNVLQIPAAESDAVLFLDTTAGIEHIYAVFSAAPWPELERALVHPGIAPAGPDEKIPQAPPLLATIQRPNGLSVRGVGGTRPTTGAPRESFVVERTEGPQHWSLPVTAEQIQASGTLLVVERWFKHVDGK